MNAPLQIESEEGRPIPKLLNYRRNHHHPETYWITCYDDECNLPGQPYADKAIVKAGMRDGGRVLSSDYVEHKIKRSEDQKAPDARDPENNLGEFHFATPGKMFRKCSRRIVTPISGGEYSGEERVFSSRMPSRDLTRA